MANQQLCVVTLQGKSSFVCCRTCRVGAVSCQKVLSKSQQTQMELK